MGRKISNVYGLMSQRYNDVRKMQTLVKTDWFRHCYEKITEPEQLRVEALVKNIDVEGIKAFKVQRCALSDLSYIAIRDIAKNLFLPNYSRKTRESLIVEIINYGTDAKEERKRYNSLTRSQKKAEKQAAIESNSD